MPAEGPNAPQAEFSNGPMARAWARQHERIDARLAPILDLLLARAAPQPGGEGVRYRLRKRHLGAGAGGAGRQDGACRRRRYRRRMGGGGAAADRRAGLAQAEVLPADAATHSFPTGGFDLLVSRFGVMVFLEPVAAFAHRRATLKPGARLALAAFRSGA